jgi:hypothetical protein
VKKNLNVFKAIETYLYPSRREKSTMKRAIMPGMAALIIMIVVAVSLSAGCQIAPENDAGKAPGTDINPITGNPPQDIIEKRGQKTNITGFNELLLRASRIQSYKYNITDTAISQDTYRFYVLGRWVKIVLPELQQLPTGEEFDEILMDRKTKTTFTHCSKTNCPKPYLDKELEKAEYDNYYLPDPMEYLYQVTDAQFLKEDMIGNDYTKVFSARFQGNEARVWLQEYYGYPLKIIVKNNDGSKRTIRFEDMTIDATRTGEIDTPTNFTVKGEQGSWIFWKHYLGEWPEEGVRLTDEEMQALFGA